MERMHVNPTCNQYMQMFMTTQGLINNNRKTMFTEPLCAGTPHLVIAGPRLTDSPARVRPAFSRLLFDPGSDCHHRMGHQAPSSAGFSHRAHQRSKAKDRGEMTLAYLSTAPSLWGSTASFQTHGSGLGSPPCSAPFSWLLYFLPVLQAKAGPSMAPSPGYHSIT